MNNKIALILAAGKGTRMKSTIPKVLHKVCGKSLLENVIDNCIDAQIPQIYSIVGHKHQEIMDSIGEKTKYIIQKEQLGTGHAVMQAMELLMENPEADVIILMGDAPLITDKIINSMLNIHNEENNSATVLTAIANNPQGYGRIIRDDTDNFIKIIEQKDANASQCLINEINSGVYCFKAKDLIYALGKISNNNVQGEYYLTDAIQILDSSKYKVGTFKTLEESIMAVNSKWELSQVERIMQLSINKNFMDEGVIFINPDSTYINKGVIIGKDTVIYPNSIITGKSKIGENCLIGMNCRIEDSEIGDNVEIQSSSILQSNVKKDSHIGPYAYIRPNCTIGERAKIGDFVEVKNSIIGDDSKASHLTYIGDAQVGNRVNLGCGVIFVNYDGINKNKTIVEDDVFVGCNTNLISPVTVKNGSYIAAGSTITHDVPQESLAIARSRQITKEGYCKKK